MTESLSKSIEKIREVATGLNKATDDAQATVALVEKFLSKCSIGIGAHVQFSDDDLSEEMSRQTYLSYMRVDGSFRIAVNWSLCRENAENGIPEFKTMSDEQNPAVAWGSCSRDIKLKSFGSLPELLVKIAEKSIDLSQKANETTETVQQILNAVDGK